MLKQADFLVDVTCNHPDYSSSFYRFAVSSSDYDSDDELKTDIIKRVNKYGFWDEVIIEVLCIIDGKIERVAL